MKKSIFTFAALIALAAPMVGATALHADETTGEKMENSADQAKTDTKTTVRKAKRHTRNATGHHSMKKDAQDKMNDAGDQMNTDANKMKDKAD
jgi:hypothetical protein